MRFRSAFFFALSVSLSFPLPAGADEMADYLIRGATIFDGKSLKGFKADVAVTGDRISRIGKIPKDAAKQVINAKGLILAPGFIDAHTHSDFNPLVYPKLPNKLAQGVTTEIVGNCGMSAAPVLGTHAERVAGVWAREGVEIGDSVQWASVADYREALARRGLSGNFAVLIGHGNVRSAVMGFTPKPASESDLLEMKKIIRQGMAEGAFGISYGLVYVPGIFAEKNELVELCREAARANGICAFHIRNEGSALVESVREAVDIGREAQAAVQISHLKAAGRNNWDKIGGAFEILEDARLHGVPVAADVYPYTASFAELGVILPDALYQREDRVDYFRNPLNREALLRVLRRHYEERAMKWDTIMIAATAHKKYWKYEGKTIRDIARATGKEPEQFLIEILADTSFEVSAFGFSQNSDVVDKVLTRPYVAPGSDSIADGSRKPHPRAYGTFPKIFRETVRERKLLPAGEAIRKMTSLVAEHFGIPERGQVREGFYADLVLFDDGKIADKATYEKPAELPEGVRWVFVNGRPAVSDGRWTGEKAGRVLSR